MPDNLPTALTAADASIVKGMLSRGDRQHDIAAWFGVNSGRIADIAKNRKHPDTLAAPPHTLPPPGPHSYFAPRPGMSLSDQTLQALAALDLKWSRSLAEQREELLRQTHERRQTNEKLDLLLRQILKVQRDLKIVEQPATPKSTRLRPLTA
jgi:hypothetical protein